MTDTDSQTLTQVLEFRVLLSSIWKASVQHVEARLAEAGLDLTRLQHGVLRIVSVEGPQTMSELSRKFGLDPSTLVPTLDALERKQLIQRERDPNDRRRIPISLTAAGVEAVQTIHPVGQDDPMMQALAHLGADDAQQLLTLLCQVLHHLPEGGDILANSQSQLAAYGAEERYLICKQK
jgi:DNA-binding MarR family transcriptional regulator